MEKKLKDLHVRCDEASYSLYLEAAKRDGVTLSSLVNKLLVDYANKDVDVQNELLASNSRLIADVRRLQNETVLLYNMMHAFVHTFFCAFPERCAHEFSDKNGTERDAHQRAAKKLMKEWRQKLLASRQVVQASLAETEARINAEAKR